MADKQTETIDLGAAENMTIQHYEPDDSILLWVPSVPKHKSKNLTCKWHCAYKVTEVNNPYKVTEVNNPYKVTEVNKGKNK